MTPSWSPHPEFVSSANLAHYMRWLAEHRNLTFRSYHELWTWSVEHLDDFWSSLFGYFAILHDGTWSHVHEGKMPHTRWFDGVRLSYAEHIFRQENPERPAILYQNESQSIKSVSWSELKEMTVRVQHFLRTAGVEMSDRVVAYLPNIPETTACFLAANAT